MNILKLEIVVTDLKSLLVVNSGKSLANGGKYNF